MSDLSVSLQYLSTSLTIIDHLFSPENPLCRYIILVLVCFIKFGPFYTALNLSAIQTEIMETVNLDETQFAALFSVYLWPNILLASLGGYLSDKYLGIRVAGITYASIMLLGHIIFVFATWLGSYPLMLFGRFLYGVPFHSLLAVQQTFLNSWFNGKELHLAFGAMVCIARLATGVNFLTTQSVYDFFHKYTSGTNCLALVMAFTGLTSVISLAAVTAACAIDIKAEKMRTQPVVRKRKELMKLSNIGDFNVAYWLLTFTMVTFYVGVNPFLALSTPFFMKKYEMSQIFADHLNGTVFVVAAITAPLIGFLIDRTGRNLNWLLLATFMAFVSHGLLFVSTITPWFSMVFLAIAFSIMAACLWPMISSVVPPHMIATAFGVGLSSQVLGTTLSPLLSGYLIEHQGYIFSEAFFVFCFAICLCSNFLLYVVEFERSFGMNKSKSL